MPNPTSNIEPIARHICELMRSTTHTDYQHASFVDRCWPAVAAQLEVGVIDEHGNELKRVEIEEGLATYRDWCWRHPRS